MVFNVPNDYLKISNNIQRNEILNIMDEFINKIGAIKGKFLDIGCGPGNHSKNLILSNLPADSILVGIDISKNMIEKARIANADEKRLIFKEMDIATNDLPEEHIESYNGAFSFFCIHWVQDLRRCYKNIFKMLRPGGSVLNQIIVSVSYFPAYLKLAEDPRYKKYMKDVLTFITPLYFEENPKKAIKKILQEVGFEVLYCSIRETMMRYGHQERKEFIRVVNPFVDKMPENMQEEFMQDLVQETLKQENVFIKPSERFLDEINAFDVLNSLVVYIKKPENY